MEPTISPVVLCGGSGARLWPVSRAQFPKQFSTILGDESLFQRSVRRLIGPEFKAPTIITNDVFRFLVLEQLSGVKVAADDVLIEPSAKNTAPAVLAAALWQYDRDPDGLMLVVPSDHVIADHDGFQSAIRASMAAAQAGQIVTFGIEPTRPETGYGYLELGGDKNDKMPVALRRFVEKPNSKNARAMVESELYLWNAGIFLFSTKVIIEAFERLQPEMYGLVKASVQGAKQDFEFIRLETDAWDKLKADSVDYAIMEKSDNLSVMPFSKGWSDLGAWDSVWNEMDVDKDDNACFGNAIAMDCEGSLLRSDADGQVLVGIGLKDVVAVAMPDAVLVMPKDDSQRVKEVVEVLKAEDFVQATEFPKVNRPWGWYESIALDERFQVKRIVVKPGASLSLQSHMHRAEHWVCVSGAAKVTIDDIVRPLYENESVYIPIGAVHRLENDGKLPLTLIEVQTGSYLGEDDIVRYEDKYSR